MAEGTGKIPRQLCVFLPYSISQMCTHHARVRESTKLQRERGSLTMTGDKNLNPGPVRDKGPYKWLTSEE